ncbi:MAG: ATP-dependent DNA helicase RecQ [Spirochaetaceae bacterium]|nr:ATP-dependent DNA helicase RecQ [Spirochaetaceae bacterium]
MSQDSVAQVAKNVFKVSSLYPWQRLVIANILECAEKLQTKDSATIDSFTRDEITETDIENKGKQVVLLPTGAGKSMCFMIPALLLEKPTLIIYPLLALMSDQMRRIEQAGLSAVVFRGQQTPQEREENFCKIAAGTKIILANPEVLCSEELLERLSHCNIIHAAIDEAHCVSEWGDSFRPSYLELGKILKRLKIPVVTAFTATASPPVLSRVTQILFDGHKPYLMQSTADRQNIHYSVQYACAKEKTILRLALTEEKPMVVFCPTRRLTEKTARFLREIFPKDNVKFYHAGLTKEEKTATEKWFFPHTKGILCCTCAFGMGVDKSDIRTVIHFSPAPTAEAYIQEAGRGGRDGKPSKAILLWGLADKLKFELFTQNSRQRIMQNYAESTTCRRQILLDALATEETVCSGCDICDTTKKKKKNNNQAQDEKIVLKHIKFHNGKWSKEEAATTMYQKRMSNFITKNYEPQDYIEILSQLVKSGTIKIKGKNKKLRYSFFSKKKTTLPHLLHFPEQELEPEQ